MALGVFALAAAGCTTPHQPMVGRHDSFAGPAYAPNTRVSSKSIAAFPRDVARRFVDQVQTEVSFPLGSSRMVDPQAVLADQAAFMRAHPNITFVVHGHMDASGAAMDQSALGKARAQVIVAQLIALGVNPAQITAELAPKYDSPLGYRSTAHRGRAVTEVSGWQLTQTPET